MENVFIRKATGVITQEKAQELYELILDTFVHDEKMPLKNRMEDITVSGLLEWHEGFSAYGICYCPSIRKGRRYWTISLNKAYLHGELGQSWESLSNTIAHEIIHLFPNCFNHGREFKKWSQYVNNEYGLNVQNTGNEEEHEMFMNTEFEKLPYLMICPCCGEKFYRARKDNNGNINNMILGRVGLVHKCKKNKCQKTDLLLIRSSKKDLPKPSGARRSQELFDKWLEKHFPPNAVAGKDFVWTLDKVEKDYWWKKEAEIEEDTSDMAANRITPPSNLVETKVNKKKKKQRLEFEQLSLF